jgi:2-polyprenyl-6-methoxyphenol hydroxylase-like FAD-dependent oxidoreductase
VLLGDAAHPMLQYAAQGAAQALKDACALADAYKKHGSSNIEAVFREYEQERIPLTSKIVHFARDIGNFAHQSGEAKVMRDEVLRMHDMHDFDCIQWLYEEK